jgi:hypothetical protein
MKIKELIIKLQAFDQELEIFYENIDNYYGKSNEIIRNIEEEFVDSFGTENHQLLNEKEIKEYTDLKAQLSMSYFNDWKDKEKLMNDKIKKIDEDIMLSDYAKQIKKDEIYKDKYYADILKDKALYNEATDKLLRYKEKMVREKIIVLS